MDEPMYAQRHMHLFKDYIIPRDENFSPEVQGGMSWVRELPRLNETVIACNGEFQRSRLRALQYVDEIVENAVKAPDEVSQLENTYIFYTTDNEYHISQHRMHPATMHQVMQPETTYTKSSRHWRELQPILFGVVRTLSRIYDLRTDPGEMWNLLSEEHSHTDYRLSNQPFSQSILA
ncbi:hypothetical protein EDB80DRAFT_863778 [Ilyonectria destructans]|nr:hypothetical protein EDB80DRAFT_863778 [Ilyonectria destructans]